MPEVHLPHLGDDEEELHGSPVMDNHAAEPAAGPPASRRFKLPRVPKLLLEVILISSGVFLGLVGEQWREAHHKRELAQIALRDLRRELDINRKEITGKKDYHATKRKEIERFLKADAEQRKNNNVNLQGVQLVFFEHAAWDLAVANGSLGDIDPELASSLAHAYNVQQMYEQMNQGFLQSMYIRPPTNQENIEGFLASVYIYYSDIVVYDPKLIGMYNELIPKIDHQINH